MKIIRVKILLLFFQCIELPQRHFPDNIFINFEARLKTHNFRLKTSQKCSNRLTCHPTLLK